ncbi:tagaturonate reductase [Pantoea sp. ACRSH]|uniref:tagaturonate reductase n=1 Tax=unclassified Pantoea TaxID=2630326 RepID=UPI001EF51701|nr:MULTISPECIES: tagaturonate reductase [unclassified Pantoea]MCG7367018.1 tagaturonate reductase [Pantoea sp. ACRSH]MCG7397435.1 tagaturonate reductase [Pantoea sp. ACRSC]
MQRLNRHDFPGAIYSERVIQFGEGNFLRAFIDWQLDWLNQHQGIDAGIVVVRPRNRAVSDTLNQQDGLYTTLIRGLNEQGERVSETRLIRSLNREIQPATQYDDFLALARAPQMRFLFSNTTEAGITFAEGDRLTDAPASSFPGKLTQLLWTRFEHFSGASDKGWLIVPCELIDHNGDALRELVLRYARHWQLPESFAAWVSQHCVFYNTLVDRIVTGFPPESEALAAQLGYEDRFLVAGEVYYQFILQGPRALFDELKLDALAPQVRLVEDIAPWKAQKVAILNGAHTAMVPVAFQAGLESVGDAMADPAIADFVDRLLREEIIPTLDLPRSELHAFADAVERRFRNPFIRHALLSIALNGMTKFRTRLLTPLLAAHAQSGVWPPRLTFALAALIAFYRGASGEKSWPLQDDAHWLARFEKNWHALNNDQISPEQLVREVLSDAQHWGEDLTRWPKLAHEVSRHLQNIIVHGMREALSTLG